MSKNEKCACGCGEDLDQDKSCNCSGECTCGENCNCTEDNKCNENCTCNHSCECDSDCECTEDCGCEHICKCEENKEYLKSAYTFNEMLKITNRTLNYMSAPHCWNFSAYDYLSLCYYELKNIKKAIHYIDIAILLSPDRRLQNNRKIFLNNLKN